MRPRRLRRLFACSSSTTVAVSALSVRVCSWTTGRGPNERPDWQFEKFDEVAGRFAWLGLVTLIDPAAVVAVDVGLCHCNH